MHILDAVSFLRRLFSGGISGPTWNAGPPRWTDAADHGQFDLQGHRGARGLLPENTIPAFRRALELGVPTLEMDVVISGDHQVVVSHEPWFSSVLCSLPSGEPVPARPRRAHRLFEMNYEHIARYDCGRRGNPEFPRQKAIPVAKPLLREVIAEAESYAETLGRPAPHYSIETKSRPSWEGRLHPAPEHFTQLVLDVLEAKGVVDRSIIQSFDVRTLRVARKTNPSLRLALLISRHLDRGVDRNVRRLGFVPHIYSPDCRVLSPGSIRRAHELGMKVIPWTVNRLEDMQRLQQMGVDGLITDYPDVGIRLLKEAVRPDAPPEE